MSDFNAAQVLAEAYTLYKKHHDGMGLDFKIAIAQIREESEQRGAIKAWRQGYVNGFQDERHREQIGAAEEPNRANPYITDFRADQREGDGA